MVKSSHSVFGALESVRELMFQKSGFMSVIISQPPYYLHHFTVDTVSKCCG